MAREGKIERRAGRVFVAVHTVIPPLVDSHEYYELRSAVRVDERGAECGHCEISELPTGSVFRSTAQRGIWSAPGLLVRTPGRALLNPAFEGSEPAQPRLLAEQPAPNSAAFEIAVARSRRETLEQIGVVRGGEVARANPKREVMSSLMEELDALADRVTACDGRIDEWRALQVAQTRGLEELARAMQSLEERIAKLEQTTVEGPVARTED